MQEDWLHIVSAVGGRRGILGSSFFQLKEDKMLRTNLKLWSSEEDNDWTTLMDLLLFVPLWVRLNNLLAHCPHKKTKQQICLVPHALLQLLLQCHYKIFIHGKSLWFQPVTWLRAPGWSQHVIQTGALAADLSCTTPLSAPSQQTPGEEQLIRPNLLTHCVWREIKREEDV